MATLFLVSFVVGVVALVGTFLLGELGGHHGDFGGHHVDLGGHHGDLGGTHAESDGLPFLSLTTIAIALFGFGLGGLVGQLAIGNTALSLAMAVGSCALVVFFCRGLLLPYILRQQSNSHAGRESYAGRIGTVTIAIPAGAWGEVEFTAADGSRTRMRAVSDEPAPLARGARVYIADTDRQHIHVVAVPAAD